MVPAEEPSTASLADSCGAADSAEDAVRYAVAQQEQITETPEIAAEKRLTWRIAVHHGGVVVDGDDLVGDGVDAASRLHSLAPPSGVLVSQTIRDQLPGSFLMKPAGTHRLKNYRSRCGVAYFRGVELIADVVD